jgi:histone H3/H4|tara:strand:- start:3 stop:725 length:723 start_codon:yes stop_codon:yes gene_type:complete
MTENVAMGENVEEGEVEHSPELITPPQKPKRPQSAYFLFMMEKRVELKDAHADWGIGEIGKECGRLWNELPEEQKKKYHDMTVPLKEKFDKEMVVYNEKMQEFEASRFGEDGTLLPAKISNCLPLARIKKIMRLDPDMKSVSKEASLLVSWATELFVSQLADEAGKVANGRRRRGIKYEEVSATIRKSELMAFLAQDFPPTNPSRSIVSSSSSKSKNVPAVTAGAIDTFFTASKPDIASS